MISLEEAKERCSGCVALVEKDGKWVCDEREKVVEEVECCPEGLTMEEVINMELKLVVTQEDIDDIMVGALEGGITYWCSRVEVIGEYLGEYASEQIARGGTLRLHDREENKDYDLTKEKFLKGVELWAKSPVGCNCLEQADGKLHFDTCNADAIVCDAIIQYAIFGEIVYG